MYVSCGANQRVRRRPANDGLTEVASNGPSQVVAHHCGMTSCAQTCLRLPASSWCPPMLQRCVSRFARGDTTHGCDRGCGSSGSVASRSLAFGACVSRCEARRCARAAGRRMNFDGHVVVEKPPHEHVILFRLLERILDIRPRVHELGDFGANRIVDPVNHLVRGVSTGKLSSSRVAKLHISCPQSRLA